MFPGGIGTPELILFPRVALLLFGKQLPDVDAGIDRGLHEVKMGMQVIQ